jgi:hypothetical protein
MKMFIDGDEVTIEKLRQRLENLDCGSFDDGVFETITLDHISTVGDIYFETERYSIYG